MGSEAIDRAHLNDAIDRGLAALWRRQRADGALDGVNHGGPMYAAIALVAKQLARIIDDGDQQVLQWIRSQQRADGSFSSSAGVDAGSLDATACVYAAFVSLGKGDDPTAVAAKRYVDENGGIAAVNVMYSATLATAGVLDPSAMPEPHLIFKLIPFSDALLCKFFTPWVGMSANLTQLITQCLLDHGEKASWLHPLLRVEEERVVDYLREYQNPDGTFGGAVLYTAQLLSALALMGVPHDDPNFRAAAQALDAFRVDNDEGAEYQPFTAAVWNTAVGIRATMRAGGDPDDPAYRRAIDWLLGQQCQTDAPRAWQNPAPGAPLSGGWPYVQADVNNPDCDTTGTTLQALAWVQLAKPEERLTAAIEKGQAWLLPMQNADGGWPAMMHDAGAKPPGPMFAKPFVPPLTAAAMAEAALDPPLELRDPATTGVSGRILAGLGDCGLPADHPAMVAGVKFQRDQQWHDRWWGRWEVNYQASTAFVIRGLHGAGADMSSDWIQRGVDWLEGCQNEDGGWGEDVDTYVDWQAPGPWKSRVDLTGKVIMALLAAGRGSGEAVRRGAQFLIDSQREDGSWDVDNGVYVLLPPNLFYTNPTCNLAGGVEGLAMYRRFLDGAHPFAT